jgi:hypothetical protein
MATGARTRIRAQAADEPAAVTEDIAATGRNGAGTLTRVITAPVTVVREVADDVASAARRPDAVVYWGGLAALAALGAIELPVAAALGVGVAVAGGIRRARSA